MREIKIPERDHEKPFGAPAIGAVVGALGYIIPAAIAHSAISWAACAFYAAMGALSMISTGKKMELPEMGTSRTFSWDGASNTDGPGHPIPVIYGQHKVAGQRIQSIIRTTDIDYYYCQIALSEGPIHSILDIRLNNQSYTTFPNVTVDTRLGTPDQTQMTAFGTVEHTTEANVNLINNTRNAGSGIKLMGYESNRIRVGLKCTGLKATKKDAYTNAAGSTIFFPGGGLNSSHVGKTLYIAGGTNFTPGEYKINSIINSFSAELDAVCCTGAASAGDVHIYDDDAFGINQLGAGSVDYKVEIRAGDNTTSILSLSDCAADSGSAVLSSAAGGFTADMEGHMLNIVSGSNFIPGDYEIITFTDSHTVTLDRACSSGAASAGVINVYGDSSLGGDWEEIATGTITDQVTANVGSWGWNGQLYYTDWVEIDQGIYFVRVTATVADGVCKTCVFYEIGEEIYSEATYPNVALLGIKGAESISFNGQIPNITCVVEGRKVNVYDPETDTWSEQYSSNPAWCLLDFMTNTRYGMGSWLIDPTDYDVDFDLDSWKAWAAYCDELVDDCDEGTEVRHRLDIVIDNQKSASEWMAHIASVGRAFVTKVGGKYGIVIDRPKNISQVFTPGNIKLGSFKGTYISAKEDINRVGVAFTNYDLNYEKDILYYPVTQTEQDKVRDVELYGVVRPSAAMRAAIYAYNAARLLNMSIELDVDSDALACSVGDVFAYADDVTLWGYGGRILSAKNVGGQGVATIDRDDLPFVGGTTYKMMIRLQDGSVVTKTVSAVSGNQVTFTDEFALLPVERDCVYTYGPDSQFYKTFRVTEISLNDDLTRHIVGVEYNEDVYDDTPASLPVSEQTLLPNPLLPPDQVEDLTLDQIDYLNEQGVKENAIEIWFNRPTDSVKLWGGAQIWISDPDSADSFHYLGTTRKTYYRTPRLEYCPADYVIKVYSVSPSGSVNWSEPTTATISVASNTTAPVSEYNFIVAADGTGQFDNLQDAIDALPAGGGSIYVKPGTYEVDAPIEILGSNILINGAGAGSTIFQATQNMTAVVKIGLNGATAVSNVQISNITINVNDFAANGIMIDGTSGAYTQNIKIGHLVVDKYKSGSGLDASGIYIGQYCDSVSIVESKCAATSSGYTSYGIYVCALKPSLISSCFLTGNSYGVLVASTNNTIKDCVITQNSTGISLSIASSYNTVISNCTVDNNTAHGISAGGTDNVLIDGCNIYNNARRGIYFSTTNNSRISNSHIVNNSTSGAGSYDGVYFSSSDNNKVLGNHVYGANQRYGVYINNSACDYNEINGNFLRGNYTSAYSDSGTNTLIVNNIT